MSTAPLAALYSTDLYSRMLQERIVLLVGQIDRELAQSVTLQLLYLNSSDPTKDIAIYIDSPGGYVSAGFQIIDTMQIIKPDVSTVVTGEASSMAGVILSAGTKGKRYAYPNANIMLHHIRAGTWGDIADLVRYTQFAQRLDERLFTLLEKNVGRDVRKDADRDLTMFPEEAIEYGIIDAIVPTSK